MGLFPSRRSTHRPFCLSDRPTRGNSFTMVYIWFTAAKPMNKGFSAVFTLYFLCKQQKEKNKKKRKSDGRKYSLRMFCGPFTLFVYSPTHQYFLPVGQLWAVRHREKGKVMEENMMIKEGADKAPKIPEPAGSIVRIVDGVTYTVMIHFNPESKESPKEKIKRLIKSELQSRGETY